MKEVAKENLMQLKDLLVSINDNDYIRQPEVLSGASIGQHIRHILEFYLLLISGSQSGTINYDSRKRDARIEAETKFAIATIDGLFTAIDNIDESVNVQFEANYSRDESNSNLINSSVGRELAYCIEHSIHHQAIIKAGLIAFDLTKLIDEHFGVAYSTLRYRESICAQ